MGKNSREDLEVEFGEEIASFARYFDYHIKKFNSGDFCLRFGNRLKAFLMPCFAALRHFDIRYVCIQC